MNLERPLASAQQARHYREAGFWHDETINDYLDRACAAFGDREALVDDRSRLTYAEYHRQVCNLADKLIELGIGRDDVVAIQLPNVIEFAIAVNAASRIGTPFCQFHAGCRAKEAEFILGFSGAAALIVRREFKGFDYVQMVREMAPRLPTLRHVLVVGEDVPEDLIDLLACLERRGGSTATREREARRPAADDPMRIAFTSGTTGDPKAVTHTFNTSMAPKLQNSVDEHMTEDSTALLFMPVGLNLGFGETIRALMAGCRLIYAPVFRPAEILGTIERERVTHLTAPPAGLVDLLNVPDFDRYDLSSLVTVLVGGAPCPIEVLRRWRSMAPGRLLEKYGMLEIGTGARTTFDDEPDEVEGTCGRVPPEMSLRIVDGRDRDVVPGEIGEILCRGASLTPGYYANPEANARSFTADGWFRTGDLGRFDEHGYLQVTGRRKEMIIRGGANIYPREIEEVLVRHPKVREVAIAGLPHPRLGETACAFVVSPPGEELSFEEMTTFLRDEIAVYKVPERLVVLDALPRTPTGKVRIPELLGLAGGDVGGAQA